VDHIVLVRELHGVETSTSARNSRSSPITSWNVRPASRFIVKYGRSFAS
jgi:hypothetical protein